MNKSQLRVLLFVVTGCLIGHGVAAAADRLDPPKNFWRFERQGLRALSKSEVLEEVQALGVGNSHAAALDLSRLDMPGRSIVRAGGDILETSRSIQHWAPKMPKLRTVYFAASYFLLGVDNGASAVDRQNRIMYYAINPTLRPLRDDLANFALGKAQIAFPHVQIVRGDAWQTPLMSAVASDRWRSRATRAADPDGSDPAADAAAEPCRGMGRRALVDQATARVVEYETRVRARRPGLSQDLYDELARLAGVLSERQIRLVFVTPPYFQHYNLEFGRRMPDVLSEFRSAMRRLVAEHAVEYRDFGADQRWSLDERNFSDSDHLNECGIRSFLGSLVSETAPALTGADVRPVVASASVGRRLGR